MCPVCVTKVHTFAHVLQVCPKTHGPRIHPHNRVAKFLANTLIKKEFKVAWEPSIKTPLGLLKPDLLSYNGDVAFLIDITVVSDHFDLSTAYHSKKVKYDHPDVLRFVRNLSGATNVIVGALVVNWRGAIAPESADFLKGILMKRDMKILSVRTLQYGLYVYDFWNKSTVAFAVAIDEKSSDELD